MVSHHGKWVSRNVPNEIIGDLEEFLNPKPDESGCDEIEIAINALCDSNCDNPCNDNDSDFDDE